MTFMARSGAHAIEEVIIGFQLSRPWHYAEIERLAQSHEQWKGDLPRVARNYPPNVTIDDGSGSEVIPLSASPIPLGILFDRVKPNGDLAWRLKCEGDALFVNCREYSKWSEVLETASGYMRSALKASSLGNLSIKSAILQYVNIFEWAADPAEYNIFQLLKKSNKYIPEVASNYGSMWHLHQGWFDPCDEPAAGKVLTRIHFDSELFGEIKTPATKLDIFLQFEFNDQIPVEAFFDRNSVPEECFDILRDKRKNILLGVLTQNIAKMSA